MSLRLTLRTLLAYLDDTLQAGEIKDIGQKVTESDAAQELIARIKQVTRRRRLTVPPATGPNGMDPNDVAEYLDNVLPSEQISDVEKQALESDVHLAEIAATHQILTLVLGEPAMVPPKARERMYTLVQGRETIPNRKAQPVKPQPVGALEEPGPMALSGGWLRWVLPAAAGLLIVALGLAIYQSLPTGKRDNGTLVANNRNKANEETQDNEKDKDKDKTLVKGPSDKDKSTDTKTQDKKFTPNHDDKKPVNPVVVKKRPAVEVERSLPPSTKRVSLGTYMGAVAGLPPGLITRGDDKSEWVMAKPNTTLYSHDQYTALPGFVGVLNTNSGAGVLLRGNVRAFSVAAAMEYLLDSSVVLHANDKFDLDITLLRGRVFLSNRKESGPCKMRLRFDSEVWDVTLANKGDEIAVDLTRSYTPLIDYRRGEAPLTHCYLTLLRGEAGINIDAYTTYNKEAEPRKWVLVEYDSVTKTKEPVTIAAVPAAMSKQPPSPDIIPEPLRPGLRRTLAALKDLETLLANRKSPLVALQETMENTDPAARLVAIYCLAAVDEVGKLVDALSDADVTHAPDREAAFYTLQVWISRSATQGKLLYDEKTGTGVLIDKKFRKREAEEAIRLLHPPLADTFNKVTTFQDLAADLEHSRIAIAEMAFWHLVMLSRGVKLPTNWNAAASTEERERYAGEILKLIDRKALPPAAAPRPTAPPAPDAATGDTSPSSKKGKE